MAERSHYVYGTRMMVDLRQERVIMASSSRRAFEEATGVSPDFISKTGNKAEIEAARRAPGELLVRYGMTDQFRFEVLPREKWSSRYREAEKRRAHSVTAAQVRVLRRISEAGGRFSAGAKEADTVDRLTALGLAEKGAEGLSVTKLGEEVLARIGTRRTVDVRVIDQEARMDDRRREREDLREQSAAREEARSAVIDAARAAARQQGSIDAVFEAVDRLDALENSSRLTGDVSSSALDRIVRR